MKRPLVCLLPGALMCLCSCNNGESKVIKDVSLIGDMANSRNWSELKDIAYDDPAVGFSLSPEEAARFLTAFSKSSKAQLELKSKGIRSQTSSKLIYEYEVYLNGVKSEYPMLFYGYHRGKGKWVAKSSDITMTVLGAYFPDSTERISAIGKALKETRLKSFGQRGHYTTPERIDLYLSGQLPKDQLYQSEMP